MEKSVHDEQGDARDYVNSSISYMVEMAEKPVRYLCTPPPGSPELTWRLAQHPMRIYNGRNMPQPLSLDRQGFILRRAETAMLDFYDEKQVLQVYYPEVERLVREVTGARKVLMFDHNLRCGSKAERRTTGAYPPAKFAHADYTQTSAPQRVRELLPAQEARERLENRYVFVNVWRPIKGPVEDDALAVCDAQTVARSDLVATDLIYADRTGEFYNLKFNPNHRWYYFRHMERSEPLVFKCFDSKDAKTVPHSAFHDPTAALNAPPRESIEVRTIAFL